MSFKLFPGFVVGVRERRGWSTLPITEFSLARYRPFVFFPLNIGVLTLAAGLIAAQAAIAQFGALLLMVGGLIYVAVMGRALSYAYRASAPPSSSDPLRILPGDSQSGNDSIIQ
jgi:hypothetical protein